MKKIRPRQKGSGSLSCGRECEGGLRRTGEAIGGVINRTCQAECLRRRLPATRTPYPLIPPRSEIQGARETGP